LAALAPDVILAHGTSTVRPLLQATRTVPIVFPIAGDPVGAGEHARRQFETERLGGLEVDDQLILGRRLYRQVGRLLAPEDAIDIAGRAAEPDWPPLSGPGGMLV
jgi:hypothetical protein